MKVRFSPEYTAKMKRREAADTRSRRAGARKIIEAWVSAWGTLDVPWLSIETCPFAAYEDLYGLGGTIFVKAGDEVAMVTIHRRYGRPLKVISPGEIVLTDHGVSIEGAEYAEFDHPDWWFAWEMTDVHGGMTYAGGEETGREEVRFVPTHWLPFPLKPTDAALS